MERFWIIPFSKWRWVPAIRLHHILRSDNDRHFHDHPWNFVSIILRGGYTEVRPTWNKSGIYTGNTQRWYGPGSILFRSAKCWHRLNIPDGTTCWTFFISFRYRQKWGFLLQPEMKMRYESYLNLPENAPR